MLHILKSQGVLQSQLIDVTQQALRVPEPPSSINRD